MTAVYLRELRSYFITPIGYIYAAMCLFFVLFYYTLLAPNPDGRQHAACALFPVYDGCVLHPHPAADDEAVCRRPPSENRALLLTSPVSLFGMVMGNILAALTVFAATLAVNSFNFFLLYRYGTPNGAVIAANVLGVFFLGAAFIAVGVFLSSVTEKTS